MSDQDARGTHWWDSHSVEPGLSARWRIGPLTLSVLSGHQEWQLAYDWDPEHEDAQDWEYDGEAAFPEEPANPERYVVGDTGDVIRLAPAAADRPVITKPRVPLYLLPGQQTTLYVGSPIWIRVMVGDPEIEIKQLPSRRPSDSWFGGPTAGGELCYAIRTRARTDLDELPVLSRSALTPVQIRNQASDPLSFEQLKLPVPYLSLFSAADGRLWTEGVSLTRSEDSGMAALDVGSGPPPEAPGAELLTPARLGSQPNLLVRAFSRVFGSGE